MKRISWASRQLALAVASILFFAVAACGQELRVMTSGAFTEAYRHLAPEYERSTHVKIVTAYGASMGDAPDSIPSRLQRGEPADVVILAGPALDELIKQGEVVPGSRVDLVRSSIGMAVHAGAPKPDISSVEALKRTLLKAKSIAYSDSASGVYLSHELFQRLGIAEQILGKCRRIQGEPVGAVVARGEVEIGFQQISELLPVTGIEFVGPLPPGAQKVTVFAAGIARSSHNLDAARALVKFFASPAAIPAIKKSGLEPIPSH
jgi:molybdate transport system substrate-binding protein